MPLSRKSKPPFRHTRARMSSSCAPLREGEPLCVAGEAEILALARAYNAWADGGRRAPPIPSPSEMPPEELQREVQRRMWGRCADDAACVLETVGAEELRRRNLRVARPSSWDQNPTRWLSNFDIEACLSQHAVVPENRMRFLGAVPSDFAEEQGPWGRCLIDRVCATDFDEDPFADWFVLVVNLDRSGMPGSHWVCLVICVDEANPNYGFTWFDSGGGPVIPGVARFVARARRESARLRPAPLRTLSPYRVQQGTTECGMHCILFSLLLVEGARRLGGTTPRDYARGFDDAAAVRAREILFRSRTG